MVNPNESYRPSYLFTVRLWPEEIEAGQVEWRGQVQHVLSGEARSFRDWATLIGHLLTLLPDSEEQASKGVEESGVPDDTRTERGPV